MRNNLYWRVSAIIIFSSFLFLLSFFVFIRPQLVSHSIDTNTTNLLALTKSIAIQIGLQIDESCTEKWIANQNNKYSNEYSVLAIITIPNCGEDDLTHIDISKFDNQPLLSRSLSGELITDIQGNTTSNDLAAVITSPIRKNDQIIGVIEVKKTLRDELVFLSGLSRQFQLWWGVTTLIVLSLGLYLASIYSKPIKKINRILKKFPQFDNDLPPNRKDEIGELFKSLTDAIQKINEITDRLEKDNQSISAILNEMEDGILITDFQGNVTFLNPAVIRFFGLQKNPALNHNIVETLRDHRLEEYRIKSMDSSYPQRIGLEIASKKLFLDCIISPLKTGSTGSTLFLLQDVTKLRKLENIRRDFVSNVSHELRTPLASLKAIAETLQGDLGRDEKESTRFLRMMDGEIDNLTHMVQELVELSQIESGKMPLNKEQFSPAEIAQKAMERMRLQVDRAGLEISFSSRGEIPNISMDPTRIGQVLMNLIHNAIKYTEPGGKINVNVELHERDVLFSVRDNGIGIPPRDLERIFERFYKVDRSRSERGTGLGLSIVRHIVNAHGGQIWAESIQTQGSTFFFSLPISV